MIYIFKIIENYFNIIGADGYIGKKLVKSIPKEIQVRKFGFGNVNDQIQFDLTNLEKNVFDQVKEGDYVVYLAAISSPDVCTNEYDYAYKINVKNTCDLIDYLLEKKANVLFFSSDVVYGKNKSDLINDEESEHNPFGSYAEMKNIVEMKYQNHANFKVFRLSYVFSFEDKFTKYLLECLNNEKEAEIFNGLDRNIIYLDDILEAVYRLGINFNKFKNNSFNLCGVELLSRKQLTELFVDEFKSLQFKVVEEPLNFYKSRARIIKTKSLYLEDLLNRKPTSIKEAIKKEKLK